MIQNFQYGATYEAEFVTSLISNSRSRIGISNSLTNCLKLLDWRTYTFKYDETINLQIEKYCASFIIL